MVAVPDGLSVTDSPAASAGTQGSRGRPGPWALVIERPRPYGGYFFSAVVWIWPRTFAGSPVSAVPMICLICALTGVHAGSVNG